MLRPMLCQPSQKVRNHPCIWCYVLPFHLVLSSLCLVSVLSCPALPCPVLSCPVLSCPALSCPVLSCPVLYCLVLSCLALSSLLIVQSGDWCVLWFACIVWWQSCDYPVRCKLVRCGIVFSCPALSCPVSIWLVLSSVLSCLNLSRLCLLFRFLLSSLLFILIGPFLLFLLDALL